MPICSKSLQLQGSLPLNPDQGLCLWTPLGLPPQTPVIGLCPSRARHPFQPLCVCLITNSNLAFLLFALAPFLMAEFIDVRGQFRTSKLFFLIHFLPQPQKYFASMTSLPIPLSRSASYGMRPLPGPRFAGVIAVLMGVHIMGYK